ncbi:MAG: phosphoribosyltransferase family protein [bacterium]|nr:phosphoribosyltransferase family protein [bacterium]
MQKDPHTVLEQVGALLRGHFVLASGNHAAEYVNKDALYPHIRETSDLCRRMAEFADPAIEVVAAPAIGGVVLSQWVAHHLALRTGNDILAVYAEPAQDGTLAFKRGYDRLLPGKNVLVVEDVLTTGGSAKKVVDAVRQLHGEVTDVCVLSNRGGVTAEQLGVSRLHALTSIPMELYESEDCPLCREGVEVNTEVGKGAQFLASKASP